MTTQYMLILDIFTALTVVFPQGMLQTKNCSSWFYCKETHLIVNNEDVEVQHFAWSQVAPWTSSLTRVWTCRVCSWWYPHSFKEVDKSQPMISVSYRIYPGLGNCANATPMLELSCFIVCEKSAYLPSLQCCWRISVIVHGKFFLHDWQVFVLTC